MPKLRSSDSIQNIPPIKNIIIRTNPRIHWATMFCTCVTSFVTLVIREPVENRSVCSRDNDIIFPKQSFLMSFPKFWLARLVKTPESTPKLPPRNTTPIILTPTDITMDKSPTLLFDSPRTPSSTIVLIIPGCTRSIRTSPIINNGASTTYSQYFFKYLNIFSPSCKKCINPSVISGFMHFATRYSFLFCIQFTA